MSEQYRYFRNTYSDDPTEQKMLYRYNLADPSGKVERRFSDQEWVGSAYTPHGLRVSFRETDSTGQPLPESSAEGEVEPTPVRGDALPALKPAYHAPIYKTGLATWQYKQPCDWSENRSVSRWLLGPCPRCGSITKTYGGGYSCCNDACPNSASRFVTCTDDPTPKWWGSDVQVFKDGNAWCAVDGVTFVNLQESPAGFGDTPNAAVKALEKAWQADAEKTFAEGKMPEKLALPTLPAPAPDAGDIESQVCADIKGRQQAGIAKYGTTVSANPLPLREWLQHAYEEALDMAIYLKRSISELE